MQFTDDQREFTREELDGIAPHNPVYTQIGWGTAVLNTKAMELGGIANDMPDPGQETGGRVWRDADGNITGKFTGSIFLKWQLRPLFPEVTGGTAVAGLKAEIADYLKLGVTTSMTYNGPEFPEEGLDYIREHLVDTGELDMRIYYPPHFGRNVSAWTPEEVPGVVAGLGIHQPFSGPEMYQMLEIFEDVNETYPITHLRWRFEHAQGLSEATIERAKALGMAIGVHSSAAMSSPETRNANAFRASLLERQDAPPIRWYQDSGIPFGLGSDAQVVAHDSPFFTLYWVVAGKDTAGQPYFKHGTLSREEALIAHTRSNAFLMHKEELLGTLEDGKLADLVVLDRDYMTIPADDIRDLNSVLTMVDGRVVYEAL